MHNERGKALGVVAFDFDQDGWTDVLVANDTVPNLLYHNQGGASFKEVALETGVAVSELGKPTAGMGVDVADELNTGRESIVVSNFSGEQLTLLRPLAGGHYIDRAAESGIGTASQMYLGFGVLFLDFDLDGWQDLAVSNGHIQGDVAVRNTGVVYREPALLLQNTGGGKYHDVSPSLGKDISAAQIGRGAAWCDFDNDGDPDILFTSNRGDPEAGTTPQDGRARLLRDDNKTGRHWLRVVLQGTQSNRNAYGARVRVQVGGRTLTQIVKASHSYLSQSDRRLLFGLGTSGMVERVDIMWPSGQVQTLPSAVADQTLNVQEPAAPDSGP
jgi:hypothetical protein